MSFAQPLAAPVARPGRLSRASIAATGLLVYALFLVTFVAMAAFVCGLLDRGMPGLPAREPATGGALPQAILVDVALLGLFALQHTVMARPAFKARWTRVVSPALERSLFVLATCLVLALLLVQWRPIAGVAWHVTGAGAAALWALSAAGWVTVLYATFLIDHFELFGLRQALRHALGRAPRPAVFRERSLYRVTRHPLMLGFLVAFWSVPVMRWDGLLFAATATAYVLGLGLVLEERDLRAAHGERYADYARRVPRLLPLPRRAG